MRCYIVHIILLMLPGYSVIGQTSNNTPIEEEYVVPFDSLATKDKIHYNFQAGVSLGSEGSFTTFYRPSVSYQLSPKFKINTGFIYLNSRLSNSFLSKDYTYQLFDGNISQFIAYVGGKYSLTNRLSIGGSVNYDFTSYNLFNQASSSPVDNISYSANFEYKVAKNITIYGEIRVREGAVYNPFNRSQGGNYNSMFGDSYGFPYRTW